MNRLRLATSTATATIALVVLLGVGPIARSTILAGYAIVIAAIAMAALNAAMRAARADEASRFESMLRRERTPPSRPPDLVRTEREIVLATSDEGHYRRRLRPLLEEIAAARGRALRLGTEAPTMRDLRRALDELEAR